jgi:cellulose synthase (UDP-forming)
MSYSRTMQARFHERAALRKTVALVYVAVMLVYLSWRLTIINPTSLTLSLVYLFAEILGFVLGLVMIFCSWRYCHREPKRAPPGLKVDIFVTTYQEPIDLVRWTLIAAKEVSYPHQTFVLDDGNRPEMKALAAQLGILYLARADNTDAKAGNLNHGLAHSAADFVMVLDADHIVMPHALDVTLGFFSDERVALVQTPQDFYNIDAFQYVNARRNGGLWHDQTFFYNIAEPCREVHNGSSCIGTGVVYRRAALDAIGGIPVDTVTEDMQTSLKLHKRGYQTIYINEPVAYGVAAADIREFYKTRHRWAHGNLHALRVEKILSCKGLTLGQRLSYLTLGLIYLEGWQQLLLYSVPVVSLLLGWAPFQITVTNVLVVLFFPILTTMLLQELGCGFSRAWVNEIFSVARFPLHLMSWAALFGRKKIPFRTSRKNVRGDTEWLLLTPQLSVLAISLGACTFGIVNIALDFQVGPLAEAFVMISAGEFSSVEWNAPLHEGYTLELVIVSGFWALFNTSKTFYLVRKARADSLKQTDEYSFNVRLPMQLRDRRQHFAARIAKVSRTSLTGILYEPHSVRVGQRISGRLFLPARPLDVDLRITQWSAVAREFQAELIWRDPTLAEVLMRALYSVDWHREFLHRNAYFTTPLEALGRMLTWRPPFPRRSPEWLPALCRDSATPQPFYSVVGPDEDGHADLIAFRALTPGELLETELYSPAGTVGRIIMIERPEALRSLTHAGLDGAQPHRYRGKILGAVASAGSQMTEAAAE